MSKQVQIRRDTDANIATFTGAQGEITATTDTQILALHDGSTAGGKAQQPATAATLALAATTPAADRLPYFDGVSTAALATFTTAGRALVDDADAAAQRTTLGLGTAATQATGAFQAADAELAAIAGLTSAADRLPYFTGSGAASLATFTAAGRALVDDADAAAQRTTLGLGTAALSASGDFQPIDADLTALAGLTSAADKLPYFTGSAAAAVTAFTAAGRALVDDADAAAQRTTLGLGTAATSATGDFEASGAVATSAALGPILAPAASARNVIQAGGTGVVPAAVKAFSAGQTADLFQVQNSSGTVLSQVDATGKFSVWSADFHLGDTVPLATGALATFSVIAPFAGKFVKCWAKAQTGPTGAALICDINLNGTTIWATQGNRITIAAAATAGTQTSFDTATFAAGDLLTIDIDQIGSIVAGLRVTISLVCLINNA